MCCQGLGTLKYFEKDRDVHLSQERFEYYPYPSNVHVCLGCSVLFYSTLFYVYNS